MSSNIAAKFTATQVEQDCPKPLQDLQKRIAVHLDKASKYDEKAEQHRTSAGQLFAQVQKAFDEGGFAAFHEKFFPDLGRSRAYELLAIGTGKKSVEDIREGNRERQARYRANHKALSVTVTDDKPFASNGEQSIEERRAQMAALAAEPESESGAPASRDEDSRHDRTNDNGDDRKDADRGDLDHGDDHHRDVNAAEQQSPKSGRKKPTPLESFEKWIDWVLRTCEHAGEWAEIPALNTEQQLAVISRLRESITALQALSARLTNDADQDEQILRDLMLEEFFARASGSDIYDRISETRRNKVIPDFLDKLTVEGMLRMMSEEFGRQLRARVPAPKRKSGNHKSDKPFKKTLNLTANSSRHERGNRSRH
jgi:hypothetical protein